MLRSRALGDAGVLVVDASAPLPDATSRDAASSDTPPSAFSEAGVGERLLVIGSPAQGWTFSFAPWPLREPLAVVFGSDGGAQRRVEFYGDAALALRKLRESHTDAAYGPETGPLGVRDDSGSRYLLVFPNAMP